MKLQPKHRFPVSELEKRVENLNDQIKDIFHATKLNMDALGVQLRAEKEAKLTITTLAHCQEEFQNIQHLFEERGSLRLEYLITEQIKEEEAKVRRERLVEYEDKIYDQRRLIADKESFYDGLLKPRRRRPAHMTIEEFHSMRRQEIITEERRNLKRLDEETQELKLIERALKTENDELQKHNFLLERQQLTQQEITTLETLLYKNPTMYDNIEKLPPKRDDKGQIQKLYSNITEIESESSELYKQYMQERQLWQYLKWDSDKLKAKYQSKQNDKIEQEIKIKDMFTQRRSYRFRRACSI